MPTSSAPSTRWRCSASFRMPSSPCSRHRSHDPREARRLAGVDDRGVSRRARARVEVIRVLAVQPGFRCSPGRPSPNARWKAGARDRSRRLPWQLLSWALPPHARVTGATTSRPLLTDLPGQPLADEDCPPRPWVGRLLGPPHAPPSSRDTSKSSLPTSLAHLVELAKALVERGDAARAAEVCRRGLEHHPSSILGRVVWGRALLAIGDAAAALAQLEAAVAVDPSSPYAFNLVGEALVAKQLHAEALPYLERALELQPADARVRGWLEQVRRALGVTAGQQPARQLRRRRRREDGRAGDRRRSDRHLVPVPGPTDQLANHPERRDAGWRRRGSRDAAQAARSRGTPQAARSRGTPKAARSRRITASAAERSRGPRPCSRASPRRWTQAQHRATAHPPPRRRCAHPRPPRPSAPMRRARCCTCSPTRRRGTSSVRAARAPAPRGRLLAPRRRGRGGAARAAVRGGAPPEAARADAAARPLAGPPAQPPPRRGRPRARLRRRGHGLPHR